MAKYKSKSNEIGECIANSEYHTALYKFVQSHFPDAKVYSSQSPVQFISKTVNAQYTNFRFVKGWNSIYVVPYTELEFEYNGETKTIIVSSSPAKSRLAYISYRRDRATNKYTIRFSRMTFNFKNNNFKDDMLNSCRAQIMEFVKTHSECVLDTKHLEPRLKKLLAFT